MLFLQLIFDTFFNSLTYKTFLFCFAGKLFYIYCFAEVLAMFFGYFLFEKLREISTARDEILPNMILAFATIFALSTFM